MTENKTHYKMYKSHKNWVIAGITVCGGILAAQNMNTNIAKADNINDAHNNISNNSYNITTSSDLSKQSSKNFNSNSNLVNAKQPNVSSNGISANKNNNEENNLSVNIKSDNESVNDNINLNNSTVNNQSTANSSQNINKTNSQVGDVNAKKSIVNNQAGDNSSNKLAQNSSANSNNINANKADGDNTAHNQTIDNSASQSTTKDNKVTNNVYDASSNRLSNEKASLSLNKNVTDEQGTKYISEKPCQPVSSAVVNSNEKGFLFSAQVVPSRSLGVDVSGYQGTDMSGYAKDGAKFAIVKLSEGTGYGNGEASGQIKSALANGMEVQGYHFARFGGSVSQADAEATHAIANAQYYGLPKGSYLACDYEADASGSVSSNTAAVEEFMRRIKDAGYTPLLYSGAYYMRQHLDTNDIVKKFGTCLWVASYKTTAAVSGPDFNYFPSMNGVIMWQYSDNWKGLRVDGDVNVIPLTGNQQGGQSNPQPSQPAQTGSSSHSNSSSSSSHYKSDYRVGDQVTINRNASKWTDGQTIDHAITDGQVYTVAQVAPGYGGAVLLKASDGETMGWVNDWDVSPVTTNNSGTSNEPTWTDNLGMKWHKETGIFTVGDTPINLRWGATTHSTIITQLQPGQQIRYDAWMNDGTYTWIRQPRSDGSYAYCAVRDKNGAFGTFSDVKDNVPQPKPSESKPAPAPAPKPSNPDEHYTGQKEVNGKWQYWDNGKPVKNNYVWINDQKKECYYDGNGNMVYGQQKIDGHWQYFDPNTGAQVKNNYVWLPDDKKEVYYDGNGNMVYGWQNIWGHKVYFNPTTGAQYKNCDEIIDGQKWHFDQDGNATEVKQNNDDKQNKPSSGQSSSSSDKDNTQVGGTTQSGSSSQSSDNKQVNNSDGTTGVVSTNKDDKKVSNNNGNITISQTINYNNLVPGNKYNITIQETDPNGKVVGTTTVTFTPNESSGQVQVNMNINNLPATYDFAALSPRIASISEIGNNSPSISGGTTNVSPDKNNKPSVSGNSSDNNEENNNTNSSSSEDNKPSISGSLNDNNEGNNNNTNSSSNEDNKPSINVPSAGDVSADKSTANNVVEDNKTSENSIAGNKDISSENQSTNKDAVNITAQQSTANNNNKLSNDENNDQHYMGEELDKSKLVEGAQEDYIKNQQKTNEDVATNNSQIGSSSNISNENSNVIPQTGEANNNDKEKGMIMLASAGLIGMLGVSASIKKKDN